MIWVLPPLGVIDTVDPLLRLDNDAAVFLHKGLIGAEMLLAGFDRDSAIHVITAVELQALLVGVDIELDACGGAGHAEQGEIRGFRG